MDPRVASLLDLSSQPHELAEGLRLRIALDVVGGLAEGDDPIVARVAGGRSLKDVVVDADGGASVAGGSGEGVAELVWEILAGRPADGEFPPVRDVVDEIPTDVAELVDQLLASADRGRVGELFDALERAAEGHVASRDAVRDALGLGAAPAAARQLPPEPEPQSPAPPPPPPPAPATEPEPAPEPAAAPPPEPAPAPPPEPEPAPAPEPEPEPAPPAPAPAPPSPEPRRPLPSQPRPLQLQPSPRLAPREATQKGLQAKVVPEPIPAPVPAAPAPALTPAPTLAKAKAKAKAGESETAAAPGAARSPKPPVAAQPVAPAAPQVVVPPARLPVPPAPPPPTPEAEVEIEPEAPSEQPPARADEAPAAAAAPAAPALPAAPITRPKSRRPISESFSTDGPIALPVSKTPSSPTFTPKGTQVVKPPELPAGVKVVIAGVPVFGGAAAEAAPGDATRLASGILARPRFGSPPARVVPPIVDQPSLPTPSDVPPFRNQRTVGIVVGLVLFLVFAGALIAIVTFME